MRVCLGKYNWTPFATGVVGDVLGGLIPRWLVNYGWTVRNVSFTPGFAVCSVIHLTAFALVCLLIGEPGKIREV